MAQFLQYICTKATGPRRMVDGEVFQTVHKDVLTEATDFLRTPNRGNKHQSSNGSLGETLEDEKFIIVRTLDGNACEMRAAERFIRKTRFCSLREHIDDAKTLPLALQIDWTLLDIDDRVIIGNLDANTTA